MKGFTLIELLIAISVIAVLSTIGLTTYSGIQRDARDQKRLSGLRLIEQSLEHIRNSTGKYPSGTNLEPSAVLALTNLMGTVPTDPIPGSVFKYSALPAGCNNLSSFCTDFILCARKEGAKNHPNPSGCSSLVCSSSDNSINCGLGLAAQ